MDLFNLQGKRALVTGGTHGLGMAMAKGLAESGAELIINGHTKEKMRTALKIYSEKKFNAHGYLFDVSNEEEVKYNIEIIEKEVGPIDILVNNAAIIKRVPMRSMNISDFEEVIKIDLIAPFIVSKYVGIKMIKRRAGKIINITSMLSELGRSTVSAYAAAKGGLKMLTRNMATEWAKYNIQTNGIGPGYFITEQTASLNTSKNAFNKFITQRTPAGRWGNPEDLKGVIVFLASDASNFVNGQIIYVDGGILASIGQPTA